MDHDSLSDVPMRDLSRTLIKACLNGDRMRAEHPAVPVSPEELALDATRAVAAGAGALHVHPRRSDGSETLDPASCATVVAALREACPEVPIGLTTKASIEPDLMRRLDLIGAWTLQPDFASVNFSESGAMDVCRVLMSRGVGVEAGLASRKDAEALIEHGLGERCLRVLIEVEDADAAAAVSTAAAIDALLGRAGVSSPRLHHGYGMTTWAVLSAAVERGRDIRVGLEDTLQLPDGRRARDNAELVMAAVSLTRKGGRA